MIKVEIQPIIWIHGDEPQPPNHNPGYVLRVRDGDNGNILLSSTSQGYENPGFAVELAKRLFGVGDMDSLAAGAPVLEPVVLVTTYRDGSTNTEQLR